MIFGDLLKKNKRILLIGGSGTLGSSIIKSNFFKDIDYPSKKKLNLLNSKSIKNTIKKNYSLIINCAALARMRECEINPSKAIKINIIGLQKLINEIKEFEQKNKKKIKLIHISTDGVYPSIKGNYSESSKLQPYNVYGWTKLLVEQIVKTLKSFIIIRTRFFNKKKITFNTAATDIYTSMIELENLVKEIKFIAETKYNGIINIGKKRESDYLNYKKYKRNITPCKKTDIMKNVNFKIAKDASMNLKLMNKLKKK